MTAEVLRLDGVWKAFARGRERVSVLENVSLTVEAKGIVAVVGTRDQGKTTLVRVAAGMLQPDRGAVCVCDRELTGLSDRQLAGVLAADLGVATRTGPEARLTASQYVEMSLAAARQRQGRRRRLRVAEVLRQLDVERCAELKWAELSSWQRVLVEFAQAIVARPRLLLVDDVMDGLGLGKKQAAMELLEEFTRDVGCGVLMAVSDHASALRSTQVWQLNAGKLKLMHSDPDVVDVRSRSSEDQAR